MDASSSSNPVPSTSVGLDASPLPPTVTATATATTPENVTTRVIGGEEFKLPAGFDEDRSLYRPHGKWAWANGLEILSNDPGSKLGYGLEGTVNLKLGRIEEKEIIYISKLVSVWDRWRLLFSFLYLSASTRYLRPLQGVCVPWIIGVYHCNGGRLGIAQDLPHPTGWREADMFLEETQKEAIIGAYQKLHGRGILHGDAEYRHWLIGDDGKVTIIDFGFTRVLRRDEGAEKANVDLCSNWEIHTEMRKVKFMLDYKDSRETEYKLAKLRHAREEKDRAQRVPSEIINCVLHEQPQPPPTPMTEEEKASPVPALRLSDLDDWSYGDKWIAHRFEVIRQKDRAEIRKTAVPRPSIPQTLDSAPTATSSSGSSSYDSVSACSKTPNPPPVAPAGVACVGKAVFLRRNGLRSPEPKASTSAQVKAPTSGARRASTSFKRSREEEDSREETEVDSTSESGSDSESAVGKGKGKVVERVGRAKKRQRVTEAKRVDTKPQPLVSSLDAFYHPNPSAQGPPSKHTVSTAPATRKQDSGSNTTTVAFTQREQNSVAGASNNSTIHKQALESWSLFCKSRKHLEQLQDQLDVQKQSAEQHRDNFLRALLNVPAGERKSILSAIGQRDSLSILDLFPSRPKQSPKPEPSVHLRERRVQLMRTVANSQVTRSLGRPRKENPRVTDIKRLARADFTPKVRSKLGQAANKNASGGQDSAASHLPPSQSSDVSEPSSKLKTALHHMEQYQAVIMRRAELEQEQEKAGMSSRVQQYKEHPQLQNPVTKGRKDLEETRLRSPSQRLRDPQGPDAGSPSRESALPGADASDRSREENMEATDFWVTYSSLEERSSAGRISRSMPPKHVVPSKANISEPQNTANGHPCQGDGANRIGVSQTPTTKRKREGSDGEIGPDPKKSKSGRCGMM